jgi:hypothetical protein
MRITIDLRGIEGVREQFARLGNAPQHALDVTAEKLEDFIQAQIGPHAKTGMLERSLGKVRIPAGWEIGHDSRVAPYARFVHDGTKPHLIFPSKKKALRWAGGGCFTLPRLCTTRAISPTSGWTAPLRKHRSSFAPRLSA